MKKILLVVLLFCGTKLFAQITIGTSDLPMAGDIIPLAQQQNGNGNIDLTLTGPNYTWDFSTLSHDASVIDTFLSPTQVPLLYSLYFFGYNVAQRGADINLGQVSITNVCNIYKNSSTKFDFWGYGGTVSGVPAPFTCSPHDVIYKFPMQYGNTDSSDSHLTASVPTVLYFSQQRHRVNVVDGWGTVQLPGGSYPCLRIKSKIIDNDSIYIDAFSFGFNLPTQTTYEYKWIATGWNEPVLQVNANSLFGTITPSTVKYKDASTGIISPVVNSINEITVFPNPADIFCSVVSPDDFQHATLNLFDETGKLISTQSINGSPVAYIVTKNLANGIYFLQIKNQNEVTNKKIVVQH